MKTNAGGNLGIGAKLIIGLGVLIGISAVVGVLAILSMLSIQGASQQLAQEYLPETVAASEVERRTLNLMLDVRGYWLTGEDDYYKSAMTDSASVQKALDTLQGLADQYPRLVKLRESLPKAKEHYATYAKLIAETKVNTEVTAEVVAQGGLAAAEFFKNARDYLASQESSLASELRSGVRGSALSPRIQKISLIHQSLLLVTTVRQEFLRTMAFRDETSIRNAVKNFVQVRAWIREMETLTKQKSNLEQLATLLKALNAYEGEVNRWLEANGRLNELAKQRLEAGEGLSTLASAISLAAIEGSSHLGNANSATVSWSVVMISVGLLASILLGVFVAFILIRSITGPLSLVTALSKKVTGGDFAIDRQAVKSRDELGLLIESFYDMVEGLKAKASLIESIANGVLTNTIPLASGEDGLGRSMQRMQESLNEILTQVNVAVDQMASGSDQVSTAAQSLSQGATEQASSLEEISASANEIHSQSKQNAENAMTANQLAKQASQSAQQGNQQMKDLMILLEKMTKSSEETKTIVKTIDDIAFQVNLLALNANVEAARAGKYGKGFAVVAEEVRNLAVRSASAVNETTRMVEESIRNIQDVNTTALKTGDQLNGILGNANKVADFLEEIAASSQEQARAMGQINGGLDQIDQVTQSNTASAEESASASEELSGQAQQLKVMVSRFQLSDEAMRKAQARVQVSDHSLNSRSQLNHPPTKPAAATAAPFSGKKPVPGVKPAAGQPNDIILNDDFDTF